MPITEEYLRALIELQLIQSKIKDEYQVEWCVGFNKGWVSVMFKWKIVEGVAFPKDKSLIFSIPIESRVLTVRDKINDVLLEIRRSNRRKKDKDT